MAGYLLAILSSVSFGISNAYWKIPQKTIGLPKLVLFRSLIASVFFGCICLLFWLNNSNPFHLISFEARAKDYGIAFLLCLFCSFGLIMYLKSLQYSKVSISIPLTSLNVFGVLTALLILHEPFKLRYFITFPLALIGIACTQMIQNEGYTWQWSKGATFSLLASFFWGVSYALFKYSIQWIGPLPMAFLLETAVATVAFFWMLATKEAFRFSELRQAGIAKHYLILSFLLIGGTLCCNVALQRIPLMAFQFISYLQIVVAVAFDILVFKEKPTAFESIGVLLILFSVMISQA
jgi:drug/metabolite transporter (DMT)-like permease